MAAKLVDTTSLFAFRLNVALAMEHDSLSMLDELEAAAESDEVRHMFAHHADETREQIENVQKVFTILDIEALTVTCPVTVGLAEDARTLIEASDERIRDLAALNAAAGTENYEVGAYRTLIAAADGMEENSVRNLLNANLDQERHTSDELDRKIRSLLA
ncbi:ferritin-like domain-containing protein [Paramicrobacterium agarici]|uniref:YciE/YciF ferroxidase family protein n=1 Tax=Paramicrobacterium agarici TaxID=630514 RepID=UPI0011511FAD|nr:DUF892 family protein [Microbacterium agarici]TQO22179.1 ferritin-like metal-binding protein YciE [Microbacterium agarici]